ncbi:MAG: M23 family metallopeptidase [Paludibacteraceae bacterium]|nr:M23 family metallopeptidase [Paludibacteraceae bacterium]
MPEKRDSFWKRLMYKYRLSILNEDTFTEIWHTRLSRMSVFVLLTLSFFVTLGIYSLLIFYTPIRNVLPGYSESIRQRLVDETVRVDSLSATLSVQTQYISVIRDIMAGEVKSDTVKSLDSLQVIQREKLLAEAKSEATQEFMAQYEAKEKDNLQLFDVKQVSPVVTFFRPAHGVVMEHYLPENKQFGVAIQTPKNENATSVLPGTILLVEYQINNTYTMVLEHNNYISIYRNLEKPLKRVGDVVKEGESIGIASENELLRFELWRRGESVNPEEVIVF